MRKLIFLSVLCMTIGLHAQTAETRKSAAIPMQLNGFDTIRLLQPDTLRGMPLMQAIARRKSDRNFDSRNLSLQQLSDIMWVANGINRANGKRTVPSAMAQYPMQTFAVLANGIYFYNPKKHQLEPVAAGDFRALAGVQPFVQKAPLNLLYIAKGRNENDDYRWAMMDSGYSGQNVYLYCASEGLKSVVRAGAKEAELLKVMKLTNGFRFILAQTVGY